VTKFLAPKRIVMNKYRASQKNVKNWKLNIILENAKHPNNHI
jgi:hypothetical protein